MSEKKDLKAVLADLKKCRLNVGDNGKFVVECPETVVIEAGKRISEDGILIQKIKVATEKAEAKK